MTVKLSFLQILKHSYKIGPVGKTSEVSPKGRYGQNVNKLEQAIYGNV
jgi:hypothetical protein